jgi:hypothetical protein
MFLGGGFNFIDIRLPGYQFDMTTVVCQNSQLSSFITGPGDMLESAVEIQLVEKYRTTT